MIVDETVGMGEQVGKAPDEWLKLPTVVPMIEIDGEMLIVLEQPIFTKVADAHAQHPFSNLQDKRSMQYMAKVHDEIKKMRIDQPNPINGVFPIDVIFFQFPIEDEDSEQTGT